jgi:hypothetical protein
MVTEIEKSPNLKLLVDRSANLHLQLQNHVDSPLFQLVNIPLAFAQTAIESVYRAMIIVAFRQAIHETFLEDEEEYDLSIEDFRQGAAILIECQNLVEEEDFEIVCIAERFAEIPESAIYAATEPALRQRFTDEIRTLINDATFDGTSVNSLRLSDIYSKLNLMIDRSLPNLISLIDTYKFHEIEEPFRLQWLNLKFTELHDDLHANEPEETIASKISDYRTAIQNAFSVNFTHETGADDWVLASLHYAHLALVATALAFRNWVQNRISLSEEPNRIVNRFHIFRRVMGMMEFRNVTEERTNIALTQGQRVGALISIYRRPSENRQGIMSPNNFIHELGHAFDGRAGLSVKQLGSMEYTADVINLPTSRESMGEDYLRTEFYEHSRVVNDNGTATFDRAPLGDKEPSTFTPEIYLLHDLFGNKYALWDSNYNNYRFGSSFNARIDTFVHNPTASYTETVADAFLNWVRNSFVNEIGESQAAPWINFFNGNMGMFLRNAALYTLGSVQYYQLLNLIPQNPIEIGTKGESFLIRFEPETGDITAIESSETGLDSAVEIYGWLDTIPAPGQDYWLLVKTNSEQVWWIAEGAVSHTEALIRGNAAENIPPAPQVNPNLITPDRAFIDEELRIIVGF